MWLIRLYRPETAPSTIFYFDELGYVPHAKSLGNGSHLAPVSHIESFVSEQAYVLLRHPGFSAGGVVLSRAIRRRISRNSWRGIANSAILNVTYLACCVTWAPIFTSYDRSVVSEADELTPHAGCGGYS